jgi:hypothetical protein
MKTFSAQYDKDQRNLLVHAQRMIASHFAQRATLITRTRKCPLPPLLRTTAYVDRDMQIYFKFWECRLGRVRASAWKKERW